jgi:two-component system phosphate regulon response regulator PhoB
MKTRIAIIDPDDTFRLNLIAELEQSGFDAEGFLSAEELFAEGTLSLLQLIISEVALPGMSGIELCARLKNVRDIGDVSVLFASHRKTETDRLIGLSVGATDYVVKPCSIRELALRVRAILSRLAVTPSSFIVTNGYLRIDLQSQKVSAGDLALRLSRLEFKILHTFLRRVGRVFSREEILEQVWGEQSFVLIRTVDAHIRILRTKLGGAREDLETIQGVGYRLRVHAETAENASRPRSADCCQTVD